MINVWKKLILLLNIIFILPISVSARECSPEERNTINSLVNNIEISYTHKSNNLFTVEIYNIPEQLYVLTPLGNKLYYSENNTPSSEIQSYVGGKNYTFNILSVDNDECVDQMNYTKTIYIKKYNIYSEKDICKNEKYSNFKYCQTWYSGTITDEKFETELIEYEKKLNETETVDDERITESNKNMNIIIIIGVSIFIILIITCSVYIIKHKKRRKL